VKIRAFPSVDFDGTVTALGAGSFTVLRGSASVTVNVTSATLYFEPGVTSATFANLAVGRPCSRRWHEDGNRGRRHCPAGEDPLVANGSDDDFKAQLRSRVKTGGRCELIAPAPGRAERSAPLTPMAGARDPNAHASSTPLSPPSVRERSNSTAQRSQIRGNAPPNLRDTQQLGDANRIG